MQYDYRCNAMHCLRQFVSTVHHRLYCCTTNISSRIRCSSNCPHKHLCHVCRLLFLFASWSCVPCLVVGLVIGSRLFLILRRFYIGQYRNCTCCWSWSNLLERFVLPIYRCQPKNRVKIKTVISILKYFIVETSCFVK